MNATLFKHVFPFKNEQENHSLKRTIEVSLYSHHQ
jgi:hypothetical protein